MESREELVNGLVYKLADRTDMSIHELKSVIEMVSFEFSVERIKNTEIALTDGKATEELWRYFQIGKLSQNISPRSLEQYLKVVQQLCDDAHKDLPAITSDDVKVFLLRKKIVDGCTDATINSKRLYLSAVFGYLYNHGKIRANPMLQVDAVKCKSKVKQPLSDKEVELLLMACDTTLQRSRKRNIALINFMLDTGVRVSELCGLNLSDIDFDRRRGLVLGKGNKERWIYFTDRTVVRLKEYLRTRADYRSGKTDIPLFARADKQYARMCKSGVEYVLRELGRESGVTRVHPHLIRATFATNLSRKGVPINVIAKLLGHANLNTIHRYVLLTDEQVNTAIRHEY